MTRIDSLRPRRTSQARRRGRLAGVLLAGGLLAGAAGWPAAADASVLLTYGAATTVEVDPAVTYRWTDDPNGVTGDHSFFTSWWYRVGPTGGERRVSSLQLVDTVVLGPSAVRYEFTDAGGNFRIAASYGLQEAGGKSLLRESIVVNNFGSSALDLHLFRLSRSDLDINLGLETPRDYDGVERVDARTIRQWSPLDSTLSSTIEAGSEADAYEMGFGFYDFMTSPPSYHSPIGGPLADGAPSNLAWPVGDDHQLPGYTRSNLEWAWQWNLTVDPQSTQYVAIVNRLSVPEPSALWLALCALPAGLLARRRRPSYI